MLPANEKKLAYMNFSHKWKGSIKQNRMIYTQESVCLMTTTNMLGAVLTTWGEKGKRINMNDSLPSRKIYSNNNLRMYLSGYLMWLITYAIMNCK